MMTYSEMLRKMNPALRKKIHPALQKAMLKDHLEEEWEKSSETGTPGYEGSSTEKSIWFWDWKTQGMKKKPLNIKTTPVIYKKGKIT